MQLLAPWRCELTSQFIRESRWTFVLIVKKIPQGLPEVLCSQEWERHTENLKTQCRRIQLSQVATIGRKRKTGKGNSRVRSRKRSRWEGGSGSEDFWIQTKLQTSDVDFQLALEVFLFLLLLLTLHCSPRGESKSHSGQLLVQKPKESVITRDITELCSCRWPVTDRGPDTRF